MSATTKRALTAADLYDFQLLSDCRISPDGRQAIFCLQRVDRQTEKKYTNLWLATLDVDGEHLHNGPVRQFTYGDQVDRHPRWSPDGRQIAFLSNRRDEKQPQIYLIPSDGGEARPLTDLKGTIGNFEWSPDGTRLVLQFRKRDQAELDREADEQKKKLGVVARHIERVFYKVDGQGFRPLERWHLWLVDAQSGAAIQLTAGELYDEVEPTWSPDGQQILFRSNRSPDPDLAPDAVDLYLVSAAGGEMIHLETPFGTKSAPTFSPDGRQVAYFGREGEGDWWRNTGLWVLPLDGSVPARNLTADFDIDISSWVLGDLAGATLSPPTWSTDGRKIYFQVGRQGSSHLCAVSGADGALETIIGQPGTVGSVTLDREQSRLLYYRGQLGDPGQLMLHDLHTGQARQVTNLNVDLLADIDLGTVEEVWFAGAAGNNLQGWIVKPPGFDPGQRYPLIVEIHGGPLAQYGHNFMHEFYYLAAQGFVVAFCNPRGGAGYGEDHARAIWNAWGTADYADIMAWTDYLAALPYVDESRLGVTGGSYGGFMTNWIIGHTDRFNAAVTQRSVSNQISTWGACDFNWFFQYEIGDNRPPWENHEHYWEQSPLKHIGQAKTPTLVIHSEQDLRCELAQGEQIFVALKYLGVETELVLFPEESHGLSRGGRTDRRIARLEHIKRWFEKYLQPSNQYDEPSERNE